MVHAVLAVGAEGPAGGSILQSTKTTSPKMAKMIKKVIITTTIITATIINKTVQQDFMDSSTVIITMEGETISIITANTATTMDMEEDITINGDSTPTTIISITTTVFEIIGISKHTFIYLLLNITHSVVTCLVYQSRFTL